MNWRWLFPVIFLFSCIDGFISNLLYPARLPFLYKDILILLVYILFIIQEAGNQWLVKFRRHLGAGTWYLAMLFMFVAGLQIFNPGLSRIEIGILGFKIYFFYWPLAVLAYAYVDNLERARSLLKAVVYLSIFICIFAIYQFWQGPNFMPTVFGEGFKRAIVIADVMGPRMESFLRVFGTFGSTGQFSHFLVINVMLILGLLFTVRSNLEKSIMNGCLVLSFLTLLITGSRTATLHLFIMTFVFACFCRWLWRTLFIILLLTISFNFGFTYFGSSVFSRFATIKNIEMIKLRTVQHTASLFSNFLKEHPFGQGLGTASVGSRHLIEEERKTIRQIYLVENQPAKLQLETGIVGVVLFYMFLLGLCIKWLKNWLKPFNRQTYIVTSALSAYCLVILSSSLFFIIDSPPVAIFLWTQVGIVAKLTTLQSDDRNLPL